MEEREIEEKRIEVAIDALALPSESKFIFEHIRSVIVFEGEYDDFPKRPGDTEAVWRLRGGYYVVLKRVNTARDFFERAWKLQVRCSAIFGPKVGVGIDVEGRSGGYGSDRR